MNPKVTNRINNLDKLTFTLENVDVSVANALRRVILSEIDTVIFRTSPYTENKANIIVNTSKMNNEILKQRLSSIPIHIKELDIDLLKNYKVELNITNDTDKIFVVSTEHLKIKNIATNEYLNKEALKQIFKPYIPLNSNNEYYITLLYLKPKLTEQILAEKIELTCEFSIGNAKENGMYNVVSTSSFGNTPDYNEIEKQSELLKQKLKNENTNLTIEEIDKEIKNWKLLNGLRYYIKNSFDFIIQTVGVFENEEIIIKACKKIIDKVNVIENNLNNNNIKIEKSLNTMENSYDITLENEDYTIGNLLKYILFKKFYEENKILSFCGFKKLHPHHTYSIIRLSYIEETDITTIISNLQVANSIIIEIFTKIEDLFTYNQPSKKSKISNLPNLPNLPNLKKSINDEETDILSSFASMKI
jgi:DNA-directed RNA polymerase subunit L